MSKTCRVGPEEEELPDAVKAPSQCRMGPGWGGVGGCWGCADKPKAAGGGGEGGHGAYRHGELRRISCPRARGITRSTCSPSRTRSRCTHASCYLVAWHILGRWARASGGKRSAPGGLSRSRGPKAPSPKAICLREGCQRRKKPSAVQSHLACQHACARAMPLGLPFGKTKKFGCACRIHF